MKSIVIDASVALKCIVPEVDSNLAIELSRQPITRVAPDFLVLECASAICRKVRQNYLNEVEAKEVMTSVHHLPIKLVSTRKLVNAAMILAIRLDRSVYDCLYLALAINEDTHMVTADRRFYNAIIRTNIKSHVQLLGNHN